MRTGEIDGGRKIWMSGGGKAWPELLAVKNAEGSVKERG